MKLIETKAGVSGMTIYPLHNYIVAVSSYATVVNERPINWTRLNRNVLIEISKQKYIAHLIIGDPHLMAK